ncbi:hypothetical protein BKA63DRAFT_568542 [Paraphoma chrysanthemicola]|nr:hypothetical protein BKA63DRAFT_568542 [Paraphoma chrysanthemicola]
MPSTRPRPSDGPSHKMSAESVRTGIIVGVVIGVLALLILAYVLYSRRRNRGVKVGTMTGSRQSKFCEARGREEKELEIGVIQEPLPVYQKEPLKDETRLAMTAADNPRS